MRIVSERASTPGADRAITRDLISTASTRKESALRVWQPPRQVAFGRRDSHRDGYEQATQYLNAQEIPAVERDVGGHAVFFTGSTVAICWVTPVTDFRSGLTDRYERATTTLQSALSTLGVETRRGEPEGAFCPGTHSLAAEGKIAGLAQRVRCDVAVVGATVLVEGHEEIGAVLDAVYDMLDIPFEPDSTGSIARAGGQSDPDAVCREITRAMTDGTGVGQVRET